MFNWLIFNSPINKSDFDIYHTVTILNVPQAFEEPVYIWRILEYQFPLLFLEIVRAIFKVKLVNFQNPIQKIDFDIYYIKRQSLNLPEKLAGNHNLCEPSENISSLTDISVNLWNLWKIRELLLK